MAIPTKDEIRSIIYARLLTLCNSTDDDVALKAIRELGVVSGVGSENSPKALTATQQNTFVLSPDQMSGVLSGLKALGNVNHDA